MCEGFSSLLMDWAKARRNFLFNIFHLTNIYLLRPIDSKSKPQGFCSRSFPLFTVTNAELVWLNVNG